MMNDLIMTLFVLGTVIGLSWLMLRPYTPVWMREIEHRKQAMNIMDGWAGPNVGISESVRVQTRDERDGDDGRSGAQAGEER